MRSEFRLSASERDPRFLRRLWIATLVVLLPVVSAGCTGTVRPDATVPTAAVVNSAAEAESAEDLGGIDKLVEAARSEGSVVVTGALESDPYRGRLAYLFSSKYGIKVEFSDSETGSDVVSLGPDPATRPTSRLAPYRFELFKQLQLEEKDPEGLWANDYAGAMVFGYNADKLGYLSSVEEVLKRADAGDVAIRGGLDDVDSTTFAALMLACGEGDCSDYAFGVKQLERLVSSGFLATDAASIAEIRDGQRSVVIDWDFTQRARAMGLSSWGVAWGSSTPGERTVVASHAVGVNRLAPHPAAARLWVEFIFSVPAQTTLLALGAVPSLFDYMASIGGVDVNALASASLYDGAAEAPSPELIAAARDAVTKSPRLRTSG